MRNAGMYVLLYLAIAFLMMAWLSHRAENSSEFLRISREFGQIETRAILFLMILVWPLVAILWIGLAGLDWIKKR